MHIPDNEIHKANFMVIQNSSLVAPNMEEHMNIVRFENPGKSETWITRHHIDTLLFGSDKNSWVMARLMNNFNGWLGDHQSQSCNTKGTR
jgi:hypothetical protein